MLHGPPSPELLESIAEAPFCDEGWVRALESTRRYLGTGVVLLITDDARVLGRPIESPMAAGLSSVAFEMYRQEYASLDPLLPRVAEARSGDVIHCDDIVAPDVKLRSRFFNEWTFPNNVSHAMGCKFGVVDKFSFLAVAGNSELAGPCTSTQIRKLSSLAPHLRSALTVEAYQTHRRRRRHPGLIMGFLEAFDEATFLVDGRGHIVDLNEQARSLVAQSTVLGLHDERLIGSTEKDTEHLAAWLGSLRNGNGTRGLVLRGPANEPSLHLMAVRMQQARTIPGSILLFVRQDLKRRVLAEDELRELLDLTPVQAKIARRLAQAATLEEIARELNVSLGTLRVHLKRVFAKLEVKRQVELVSLILCLAPTLFSSGARDDS